MESRWIQELRKHFHGVACLAADERQGLEPGTCVVSNGIDRESLRDHPRDLAAAVGKVDALTDCCKSSVLVEDLTEDACLQAI